MTPTVLGLSTQLRQIIYYHIDNGLFDNALFLSERLYGLEPRSNDALHLLGLSYYRLGQHRIAYDYLKAVALRGAHLGCAYVFAQVCLVLGRCSDGVTALEKARPLWHDKNDLNKHSESLRRHLPDAAACCYILGKLYNADRNIKKAVDCYLKALVLNPFMWDAFERLCDAGVNVRPANIFKASEQLLAMIAATSKANVVAQPNDADRFTDLPVENYARPFVAEDDPFKTATDPLRVGMIGAPKLAQFDASSETPPHPAVQGGSNQRPPVALGPSTEPPNAPSRKQRVIGLGIKLNSDVTRPGLLGSRASSRAAIAEDVPEGGLTGHTKRTISGSVISNNVPAAAATSNAPQRRSKRLFGKPTASSALTGFREGVESTKDRAMGARARSTTSTAGRVVSGNRRPEGAEPFAKEPRHQVISTTVEINAPKVAVYDSSGDIEAIKWILDLLTKLGLGYSASSQYQKEDALRGYRSIPQQQRETPWVMAQIGKVLHEQCNYPEAEKLFARIRKRVPSRLEDMEVYSTVLWHLKSDTELAFLSHELLDIDRYSVQAWCTIGNSFSMQRDHDQALKCFKRAIQLDPNFPYSFTLQGHEYFANEEYSKATQAYRKAIAVDHRHYNGWYGLARVYEKLGKYDMAEKHYRAAAIINPTHAVLTWSIGMMLERQKRHKAALVQYEKACELAPNSALPRFKKARILMHLQDFHAALEELKALKDIVPDESNVQFMLGKLYRHFGNRAEAVKHFTTAMNLDPKAAPFIKETLESLDHDVEDEDDEDEDMN